MPAPDPEALKRVLPMPALLERLGMGQFAKASVRSPFREDTKPSWGIFQREGVWRFKDFATGESGDEISLLARTMNLDERRDFLKIAQQYAALAGFASSGPSPKPAVHTAAARPSSPASGPDCSGFTKGTPEQIVRLAKARPYHREALEWASERGVLVFGQWHGNDCYAVTDDSKHVLELRRVDGKLFPAVGDLHERKSHAVKGSQKSWPVGIREAGPFRCVALVEGIPDFLAAHYLCLWEQASHYRLRDAHCAPVAMLSGSPAICADALPLFTGKVVRIFPHADTAGLRGCAKWREQLMAAGALKVDLFDFGPYRTMEGHKVKDLEDFISRLDPIHYEQNPALWRILP